MLKCVRSSGTVLLHTDGLVCFVVCDCDLLNVTVIRSAPSASSLHFHFFSTYSFLVHGRSERWIRPRWRWRCPAASAWWPSDSRASERSVSPWPRCGQSCTLIRLGSVAGSSLFFAPLVSRFSPALSVLWAPVAPGDEPLLGGTSPPAALQPAVYWETSRGGSSRQQRPHPTLVLSIHWDLTVERKRVDDGGGGPSCRVKWGEWVLFLCGGPGVGLRGPHGRRAVGSAAAWPPALIWSLSNRGLIKLCRLCSTFTSLDVSLSARPLLYPVWCRIWPVWIRPGWTHSETHSCMIMLTGCDPPQWTACVWWAIRWYRMFSRFSGHRKVSEPSEPDYRRLFFVCVGASSAFRVQIVVNKENKPDDYCLYQIVVFSVKWIVCLQTFWISCRAEIITFMSINH